MLAPLVRVVVPARAGLVGNPSDGFGGAVVAVPVPGLAATVTASPGRFVARRPGDELVAAALSVLGLDAEVEWSTTIPRSVGLAGSSAIIVGVLQAVAPDLPAIEIARLALAAERDVLGIPAGWQDRVVQAFGAPVLVDVGDRLVPSVTVLDAIPGLVVAWNPSAAEPSAIVHRSLRDRFDADDVGVRAAMAELGNLARSAAAGTVGLAHAINRTCDLRARLGALTPATARLVDLARSCGAGAATSAGSGGAIAALAPDPAGLVADLTAAGCGALVV